MTPWTVACQAPLVMEFSRQEYWSGLPFPSPGDLPKPGIKPGTPALPADSLMSEPPGKPIHKSPMQDGVLDPTNILCTWSCEYALSDWRNHKQTFSFHLTLSIRRKHLVICLRFPSCKMMFLRQGQGQWVTFRYCFKCCRGAYCWYKTSFCYPSSVLM